jgi:hypothetical protein
MSSDGSSRYGNLTATDGVTSVNCIGLPKVICPLCGDEDTAMLAGKIAFEAKLGDDGFWEGNMVGFVCSKSHLFFLRYEDVGPPSMSS